ncbi:hypothetical protein EVA_18347 [gut metagenome]|uniref:Uncharacterized protein n=1 Tax=gut metagenome TaxID=749906 RepID=J9C176_9ZZZZ
MTTILYRFHRYSFKPCNEGEPLPGQAASSYAIRRVARRKKATPLYTNTPFILQRLMPVH